MLFAPLMFIASLVPQVEHVAAEYESAPAFQEHKEWFAAFLKNTDQKEVQKQTTLSLLQDHFPELWARIKDADYPFTSVFVGAGSGGMEIPLLKEFAKARGSAAHFSTYCEDPSLEMKKEFFASINGETESQIAEYSSLPFDDAAYLPPKADLALASHVWYFIKDWKGVEKERNTLAKFASIISDPSGAGVMTLQSKSGDRYKLNAFCASLLGKDKEIVAEEITAELQRLGIPFQTMLIESRLDVSSCFDRGLFNPNEEGKALLSFLLFTSWDELSEVTQEKMKTHFISLVKTYGKEELVLRDLHIWIIGT